MFCKMAQCHTGWLILRNKKGKHWSTGTMLSFSLLKKTHPKQEELFVTKTARAAWKPVPPNMTTMPLAKRRIVLLLMTWTSPVGDIHLQGFISGKRAVWCIYCGRMWRRAYNSRSARSQGRNSGLDLPTCSGFGFFGTEIRCIDPNWQVRRLMKTLRWLRGKKHYKNRSKVPVIPLICAE